MRECCCNGLLDLSQSSHLFPSAAKRTFYTLSEIHIETLTFDCLSVSLSLSLSLCVCVCVSLSLCLNLFPSLSLFLSSLARCPLIPDTFFVPRHITTLAALPSPHHPHRTTLTALPAPHAVHCRLCRHPEPSAGGRGGRAHQVCGRRTLRPPWPLPCVQVVQHWPRGAFTG